MMWNVAATLTVLALVLVPAAAAPGPSVDIQFRPPGNYSGALATEGTWLALFFDESSAGNLSLEASTAFDVVEHAYATLELEQTPALADSRSFVQEPVDSTSKSPARLGLVFGGRSGSLLVNADSIHFSSPNATGEILALTPDYLGDLPPDDVSDANPFWDFHGTPRDPGAALTLASSSPGQFTLDVTGLRSLVWFGTHVSCAADACPPGGGRAMRDLSWPEGDGAAGTYSYVEAAPQGASLTGTGALHGAVAFGQRLDVAIVGALRLPGAGGSACVDCLAADGQTLELKGELFLDDMALQDDGMSARLAGDVMAAKLDEAAVDPGTLFGVTALAATTAVVGLAWLAKTVLGSLFTRMRPDRALRNSYRRAIRDYVEAHPGPSLRELAGGVNLAPSTVKHHVRVLVDAGHLVEEGVGRARRFFLPRFNSPQQRQTAALLREPSLQLLHDMVRRNPGLAQNELMDLAVREHGWSRSTTQHRLGRLVRGGLVSTRKEGRLKLHAVTEPPASFRDLTAQRSQPAIAR